MFCNTIEAVAKESIQSALNEEIAQAVENMAENEDEFEGIDIIPDARHSWRKKVAQSDTVALGNVTHRVVKYRLLQGQMNL